jgi:formylmethanofuran dehydrogenase subunit A
VAIYNRNADVAAMFSYPRYVIKGGEVVVEEGELRQSPDGRQFAVKPQYDEAIEDYLRPLFQQHYTMSFENYPVSPERVHGLVVSNAECGTRSAE